MPTARDLIKQSLRKIGVLASGEEPDAADAFDALTILQQMLDNWSLDNLIVFASTPIAFALVPGDSVYTLGPTGQIVVAAGRPSDITDVITQSSSVDYPAYRVTESQFLSIRTKATASTWPTIYWYKPDFPNGSLSLYPAPSSAATTTAYAQMPLSKPVTLNTALSYPQGYEEAIVANLAVRLLPDYGRVLTQELAGIAQSSLAMVKAANIEPLKMAMDRRLLGRGGWDWRQGDI